MFPAVTQWMEIDIRRKLEYPFRKKYTEALHHEWTHLPEMSPRMRFNGIPVVTIDAISVYVWKWCYRYFDNICMISEFSMFDI